MKNAKPIHQMSLDEVLERFDQISASAPTPFTEGEMTNLAARANSVTPFSWKRNEPSGDFLTRVARDREDQQ